jgi:hypothetical protein
LPALPVAVAPEFRPTLRDELAPLQPRVRRAVAGGLVALVVVLAVAAFIASRPNGIHVVGHRPVTWNLYHPRVLRQTRPPAGELLHLEHRGAHGRLISLFVVEPLRLPAYRGNVSGVLPLLADKELAALRARIPGMVPLDEGKVHDNTASGYQLQFRVSRRPTVWGRLVLLVAPGKRSRAGVRLLMLGTPRGGNTIYTDVGKKDELRDPFRTFMFGTGRAA